MTRTNEPGEARRVADVSASRPSMPIALSDGAITIRSYVPADVDAHYEAARASAAEVYPWLPWCRPDYALEQSEAWVMGRGQAWTSEEEYSFAIVAAADGAFLGGCGINNIQREYRFANLGYWVRTGRTRRGVASAATRLTARFGFEQLHLLRIEIVAAVENVPSQRVAEKAGARREGVLRNRILHHGRSHDAVLYSLIPGDLDAATG